MTIAQQLKTSHALLDGVMLTGAFTGAVLGAVIAGVSGAIIGAIVGAVVGFAAGAGLERENTRANAHDSELDETIGVRGGDLGAREIASSALTDSQRLAAGAGTILHQDHVVLDAMSVDLAKALRAGDARATRTAFQALDQGLSTHLATEESGVFPRLEETEPEEMTLLRAQHAELRRLVEELRVDIDGGFERAWLAQMLVDRLREHTAREDALAYVIANAVLPASAAILERRTPVWGVPVHAPA